VAVPLIDGVAPFEFGLLCEVFGFDRTDDGVPLIDFRVCGERPGQPVATTIPGVSLTPAHGLDALQDVDLIALPALTVRDEYPPAIVHALRELHGSDTVALSVCNGAFLLGAAGLLDGRRCTTHWSLIDRLRRCYPAARMRDAVLYVHDGPISTSAGISAGIDLALSLVERDHGPALTAAVARELVVYLRRDGSGGQISPYLEHRSHLNSAVHRVQDHLAQHLDAPHTLADLAGVAHLSPRGLSRAFTAAIGITPLEYQQRLRLERAATLLAETDLTVDAVSARCGFRDGRHLRRLFKARYGLPPSQSRLAATR